MFPRHMLDLSNVVLKNLRHQADWTSLTLHEELSTPRPIISGLPPRRLYIHPDEQTDIIEAERSQGGEHILQLPEYEWIVPFHLREKPSLKDYAAIMDSIDALPPNTRKHEVFTADDPAWKKWRMSKRGKRVLLAIVEDDSTVVYYMMHDGIVKPRQN